MSDINSANTIRTLRYQAWERAKGELQSMLVTFWGKETNTHVDQYDDLQELIDEFVKKVEGRGLQE